MTCGDTLALGARVSRMSPPNANRRPGDEHQKNTNLPYTVQYHLPYTVQYHLPYTRCTPSIRTPSVHQGQQPVVHRPVPYTKGSSPWYTDRPYTVRTPLGTPTAVHPPYTVWYPATASPPYTVWTIYYSFGICRSVSGWLCLAVPVSRKRINRYTASHRPLRHDLRRWTSQAGPPARPSVGRSCLSIRGSIMPVHPWVTPWVTGRLAPPWVTRGTTGWPPAR